MEFEKSLIISPLKNAIHRLKSIVHFIDPCPVTYASVSLSKFFEHCRVIVNKG
jgi:hypothetical protein